MFIKFGIYPRKMWLFQDGGFLKVFSCRSLLLGTRFFCFDIFFEIGWFLHRDTSRSRMIILDERDFCLFIWYAGTQIGMLEIVGTSYHQRFFHIQLSGWKHWDLNHGDGQFCKVVTLKHPVIRCWICYFLKCILPWSFMTKSTWPCFFCQPGWFWVLKTSQVLVERNAASEIIEVGRCM